MQKLQTLIFPKIDMPASPEMYFRCAAGLDLSNQLSGSIQMAPGDDVGLDTFFNGFSILPWKQNCRIEDLHLALQGSGRLRLQFGVHELGQPQRWLTEQTIELGDAPIALELPFWPDLKDGILYFTLTALSHASLSGGYYYTHTPPINDVRLGIAVTHFNRKNYVLPAMQRISQELLGDPDLAGKIELVVVDNSRNIEADEAAAATVIPNQNLGGSGGFTRGLLHFKDRNFTHCLFMDDDASCEVEGIRRAFHLQQYAVTERMAVAGAMLRELEPHSLYEKGARFDWRCRANKLGLDMRKLDDLLRAETLDPIDYGGWWFFCFAIADAQHYPFPFFVRGDDIMFGIMNRFNIVTMNGIAVWGEDFSFKSGPMTAYQDLRNHIIQVTTQRNGSVLQIAKLVYAFFVRSSFAYNYGSADAVILALDHATSGPDFWRNNMDMAAIRQQLAPMTEAEKMRPLTDMPADAIEAGTPRGPLQLLFWLISLNGFLLPSFLIRDETAIVEKRARAAFMRTFRMKRVLYVSEEQTGYLAHHDKKKFFSGLFAVTALLFKRRKALAQLRNDGNGTVAQLTSEEFWRGIYSK